jgi:ankyrin repeat protein
MSTSLPERPDFDQLHRQAKELRDAARRGDSAAAERVARHHPSARPAEASLAAAQLVIARELGFSSWPKLRSAAAATAGGPDRRVEEFVAASTEGRLNRAAAILEADPVIARRSLHAAVVLGEAEAVRTMLSTDPEAAVAIDEERGWPPLLYACHSRWHQIDPDRAIGLAEVVRLLLEAGASPNTNNGGFGYTYRSALRGAVGANNPGVTEALLDSGANPDDGRCIEEAAGLHDHRCLELLLSRGARVAGTWALGAAVCADDPRAVSLLIEALRANMGETASEATKGLADAAAAKASHEVVAVLLAAGANPEVTDSDVGISALRCAVRAGNEDAAALLIRHGARDDSTEVDRFLGNCLNGDRRTAEQLLVEHPELPERLSDQDRAVIVDAAGSRPLATIELMLDLRFSTDDRNGFGEYPLHSAAFAGHADIVRLLLQRGAKVDARDTRFDATALASAIVGSGVQARRAGDWTETVHLLVAAGASREGAWIVGKPPSEEVMELVKLYAITPDELPEQPSDEPSERLVSTGTGVMADVAQHLEAAYRDLDLDLLGSVLHPEVRWTGLCHNRDEVLHWYRGLVADGTVATVESVEVDRDAVLLHLSVARPAEGARVAPPQQLWQVFTVDDAQVVQIRAYRDRASARAGR